MQRALSKRDDNYEREFARWWQHSVLAVLSAIALGIAMCEAFEQRLFADEQPTAPMPRRRSAKIIYLDDYR